MREAHKAEAAAAKGGPRKKEKRDYVDPKLYISTLLSVYKKYQNVVEVAFDNNEAFVKALDSACQQFINRNKTATPTARAKSRTPDLLARFSDELLRKNDSEDLAIDELMTIFNFVEDKESFEVWYRRYLSRRLMGSNMSPGAEEHEEYIIQKLKQANSLEYTNKITSMFNDIRISRDLGVLYKESTMKEPNSKDFVSDIEPRVLDSNAWSSVFKDTSDSFILPKELIKSQEKFTTIYQERFSGRQLNWIWSKGKVEVKANLARPGKPPFSFQLTLFQYAILSPYNEVQELTTSKILELTALSPEIFKVNVVPLVKNKLLVQTPPGEDNIIKPNTSFKMVKEYTSKRPKINFVIGVKAIDSRNEDKETNEEVERRHHEILKACIVRVMKARKNHKHEQLTSEVIQIIDRFVPTVADIKKAIEVLIDEQYLARTADGSGYEYLS
ncbi:unnamed protein product [Ambrosiozyma monospora]|uniref:Unnamed protein product n=1 Tax=Ambrosiozyma monospora TaxID=43982 RepID=A0A9W6Z039_AMBMO|nr:unnamed protein product [Ambrosiozyma monospora]